MKTFFKIFGVVVAAMIVIVGGGILLAHNGVDNPVSDVAEQATLGAANAALDASGIKEQIDTALHENAGEIANSTGLPVTLVDGMIDDLDVQSWQVVSLPKEAVATDTVQIDYGGYDAQLTTYDDPAIITVTLDTGSVTLEVPPEAQGYAQYLAFL